MRFRRVIDDPDVSVDEIGEIVRADAPLSPSLLRLVNSAAYGLVREVTDTAEAVRYVGSTEVKNLSVAIAVKTGLIGKAPVCNSFDRRALWKNFVAAGLGAHVTATLRGLSAKKTAFSAGLLHQVGFVLLDTVLPYKLQFVFTEVEAGEKTLLQAEREIIGFTHGEVGVWLGEKWRFPPRPRTDALLRQALGSTTEPGALGRGPRGEQARDGDIAQLYRPLVPENRRTEPRSPERRPRVPRPGSPGAASELDCLSPPMRWVAA
ncbi:MAG: HDOD domain-containing protein [Candidatus Eisenbacteria bacterium]